jgi:hypothetical protein
MDAMYRGPTDIRHRKHSSRYTDWIEMWFMNFWRVAVTGHRQGETLTLGTTRICRAKSVVCVQLDILQIYYIIFGNGRCQLFYFGTYCTNSAVIRCLLDHTGCANTVWWPVPGTTVSGHWSFWQLGIHIGIVMDGLLCCIACYVQVYC